jgi:predicted nucleic acid-binding protein
MTRLCLDTSAYSNFKRGHAPSVEAITSARTVFVPAVVLGELRTGFLLGQNAEKNERSLTGFLSSPSVEVIEIDDEVASIYAALVVDLRRAGAPLPTNDIWIAACAICEGATVLTYDEHFARIQRVSASILRA